MLRPPSWRALRPLLQGGFALLLRQGALNVGFVAATRKAQALDPTGVAAAAYAITMQIYSLGVVVQLGVQGAAAALVPAALSLPPSNGGGPRLARRTADRLFAWGATIGIGMATAQLLLIPHITPLFSTLPQIQRAVVAPCRTSALVQVLNGIIFAGEGVLMGVGGFGFLAGLTSVGVLAMVCGLMLPNCGLNGILLSLGAFHVVQAAGVLYHHLRLGPLAVRRATENGHMRE
uniref:Protein RFT1 homolog n=1 Tax=Chrysotila carterae TaxID=13221 RepID=A0A7S4BZK7_CHRCT